jgi:hypothetical protein
MAGDMRLLKGYAYGATSLVIILSIVADAADHVIQQLPEAHQ